MSQIFIFQEMEKEVINRFDSHNFFILEVVPSEPDKLKSIIDQIINILQIDDEEKKDEILEDLFKFGQQSLTKYEDYLIPDIYIKMTKTDDNELIKELKNYFEEQIRREYAHSHPWFIEYLNQIQSNDYQDLYADVFIRMAKYGNEFIKNCSILSIILQILFEGLFDQCLKEKNIFDKLLFRILFDELWFTITINGIKSMTKYSQYITENLLNEQINDNQSILYRSLSEYYHQELIPFLKDCNIRDRQNLHQLVLNQFTLLGWKDGLPTIKSQIPPKSYENLSARIENYLEEKSKKFEEQSKSFLFTFLFSMNFLESKQKE